MKSLIRGKKKGNGSWIIFVERDNIPNCIQTVIKFGQGKKTTLKVQEKVQSCNDFQELGVNCLLVLNNTIIAILLHNFIPNEHASKDVVAMVHMVEWGGALKRMCSKDMKMMMFGHKHCFNDLVLQSEFTFTYDSYLFSCIYICFWGPICHKTFVSFLHLF